MPGPGHFDLPEWDQDVPYFCAVGPSRREKRRIALAVCCLPYYRLLANNANNVLIGVYSYNVLSVNEASQSEGSAASGPSS